MNVLDVPTPLAKKIADATHDRERVSGIRHEDDRVLLLSPHIVGRHADPQLVVAPRRFGGHLVDEGVWQFQRRQGRERRLVCDACWGRLQTAVVAARPAAARADGSNSRHREERSKNLPVPHVVRLPRKRESRRAAERRGSSEVLLLIVRTELCHPLDVLADGRESDPCTARIHVAGAIDLSQLPLPISEAATLGSKSLW